MFIKKKQKKKQKQKQKKKNCFFTVKAVISDQRNVGKNLNVLKA